MTTLPLPALDGRKAVGFLGALGLCRLLEIRGGDHPRLAWDRVTSAAVLQTRHESMDALTEAILGIVRSIPEGGVIPGLPTDFPPLGAAPDRLRVTPSELRRLAEELGGPDGAEVDAWLGSLVTDLSLDDKGRSDITLMAAPSGKQSMRTMLEKPLKLVRDHPEAVREALLGWRRYPGVTGEYLDHQAIFDAVDSGSGKSEERGVPGATWLALMAYPLLRTTASRSEPVTTGWHRVPRRPPIFLYPLWSRFLPLESVVALLEHPLWDQALDGSIPPGAGVFSVFAVRRFQRRRLPGRTFAGVLAPIP